MKLIFCDYVDITKIKSIYPDTPIVVPNMFIRDYIGHKILEYTDVGDCVVDYCYSMVIWDVCKELERVYLRGVHK